MKSITSIGKKVVAMAILFLCVSTGFAQTWPFDANETRAFANWFKQPSTEAGKCNAEVLGIDINRTGFSWDDMNTWANSEGKVFVEDFNTAYVHTIWGGGFSGNTTHKGRLHYLFMSLHKKADGTYDETGSFQKIPAAMVAGLPKVAGTVDFGNVIANVVNLSGTSVTAVKLAMVSTTDCYFNIRRNPMLKQIDMSGTTGKVRQFEIYSNALEGEEGLIMNNIGNGTNQFGDWLTNIDNNLFSFSTMPDHPLKKLGLRDDHKWGSYKDQYKQTSGMPVGVFSGKEYEIEVDEDIDLSAEYDIRGKITQFTWKDEDGNTITPTSADASGWYSFGDEFIGKVVRCELRNEAYPVLALNTVWVKVVKKYTTGIQSVEDNSIKIEVDPNGNEVRISASDVQSASIYSLAGSCVKSHLDGDRSMNISALPEGLYVVKVVTLNGQKVIKFVKK